VKSNPCSDVIRAVLKGGQPPRGLGLEVGSKPELAMAMALLAPFPGSTLVCNGYKDADYMELVRSLRPDSQPDRWRPAAWSWCGF
jgi:arginine decarboxylase